MQRTAALLNPIWMAAFFMTAHPAAFAADAQSDPKPVLAICADPANLPYSDRSGQGFENRIATLLAADLHADLQYTWNVERRGFFRRTLNAGKCDAVISVPAALPMVAATRPYFTSSYVFVTRADDHVHIASFDDAYLKTARIGVPLIGSDGANAPPVMSLAARAINGQITGFPVYADDGGSAPQGRIVDAVALGRIDVAIVWGPYGGYYAKPYGDRLHVDIVPADPLLPQSTAAFPMAVGLRKADAPMKAMLQAALDRHAPEIQAILRDYGVPLVTPAIPANPTPLAPTR